MSENKPDFYYASDYAGLTFNGGSFYYGYEVSVCEECGKQTEAGSEYCKDHENADRYWCFEAKFNDQEIIIPQNKLGTDDMFDVVANLNIGIGWILAKYKLEMK